MAWSEYSAVVFCTELWMFNSNWKAIAYQASIVLSCWLGLLVVGCSPQRGVEPLEITDDVSADSIMIPSGNYENPVWLREEQFVFWYEAEQDVTNTTAELVSFDLNTKSWQVIPFETPSECPISRYGRTGRLPNGRLGFIHECTTFEPVMEIKRRLHSWDPDTEEFELLYRFPTYFRADTFAFSPDMEQFIQEQGAGNLRPELFWVKRPGEMEPFPSDFFRAVSPSWSPDGEHIAFFGNEVGPKEETSIFTGLVHIDSLLDYPWNLYVMDVRGKELRVVLSNVVYGGGTRWSPDGTRIAFTGTYNGELGTYIYHPETEKLMLLHRKHSGFDWSLDGRQMVLLEEVNSQESDKGKTLLTIITLPFAEHE